MNLSGKESLWGQNKCLNLSGNWTYPLLLLFLNEHKEFLARTQRALELFELIRLELIRLGLYGKESNSWRCSDTQQPSGTRGRAGKLPAQKTDTAPWLGRVNRYSPSWGGPRACCWLTCRRSAHDRTVPYHVPTAAASAVVHTHATASSNSDNRRHQQPAETGHIVPRVTPALLHTPLAILAMLCTLLL